jgi:nitrile hydratase beta subunit
MDTVHDIGGTQGFGPIPSAAEDDSALFDEDWKARLWAIAMMSMSKLRSDETGWTLDWYRHVLERLPPDAYLRLEYFEKWILAMMATAVDEGVAEVSEFLEGRANSDAYQYNDSTPTKAMPERAARFQLGDRVVARRDAGSMHTRLTGYVRGRPGFIASLIGPQPLPDLSAIGRVQHEQVYVVSFPMAELWPEASDSSDCLNIDMWDSYLEPA